MLDLIIEERAECTVIMCELAWPNPVGWSTFIIVILLSQAPNLGQKTSVDFVFLALYKLESARIGNSSYLL